MISADLGRQLEHFVADQVVTGRYNSKSEVLREGVRLIQDRETRLAALDASIARGLADANAYAGLVETMLLADRTSLRHIDRARGLNLPVDPIGALPPECAKAYRQTTRPARACRTSVWIAATPTRGRETLRSPASRAE